MNRWLPDRKILAGGLSAVMAYLAVMAARTWLGIEVDMETASAIVGLAGTGMAYLVPESVEVILDKADAALRDMGYVDESEYEEEHV